MFIQNIRWSNYYTTKSTHATHRGCNIRSHIFYSITIINRCENAGGEKSPILVVGIEMEIEFDLTLVSTKTHESYLRELGYKIRIGIKSQRILLYNPAFHNWCFLFSEVMNDGDGIRIGESKLQVCNSNHKTPSSRIPRVIYGQHTNISTRGFSWQKYVNPNCRWIRCHILCIGLPLLELESILWPLRFNNIAVLIPLPLQISARTHVSSSQLEIIKLMRVLRGTVNHRHFDASHHEPDCVI